MENSINADPTSRSMNGEACVVLVHNFIENVRFDYVQKSAKKLDRRQSPACLRG